MRIRQHASDLGENGFADEQVEGLFAEKSHDSCGIATLGEQGTDIDIGVEDNAHV